MKPVPTFDKRASSERVAKRHLAQGGELEKFVLSQISGISQVDVLGVEYDKGSKSLLFSLTGKVVVPLERLEKGATPGVWKAIPQRILSEVALDRGLPSSAWGHSPSEPSRIFRSSFWSPGTYRTRFSQQPWRGRGGKNQE